VAVLIDARLASRLNESTHRDTKAPNCWVRETTLGSQPSRTGP
jgi:hypothetical protein